MAITEGAAKTPFRIPLWIGACVMLAIAAFFLWSEHRAHLLGALPYVLLALCPLMHFFMHRGHGKHVEEEHDRHAHGGSR